MLYKGSQCHLRLSHSLSNLDYKSHKEEREKLVVMYACTFFF